MYYPLNRYLQDTYGTKVYKLALDGGFTCPNRDGTKGSRGCIFCSGKGSGEFAEGPAGSICEQIERARRRVEGKIKDGKYIAYFQSFTNTYAPAERLRVLFEEAIGHPDVAVLSVATRPDCLPDEVLELLSELNAVKPVWVELGLQTVHESSAAYIRRGYGLREYDEAVRKLRERGIYNVTHVIFGLPGETRDMMLDTVRHVVSCKSDGIKLQLLHVLEGTDLAEEYRKGKVRCLDMEEYIELVLDAIELLPEGLAVHRMTGDGDRRSLIAPLWSLDKKRVLNSINAGLKERGLM